MLPAYPLVLASASADGTALTNSIAATSILHGSGIATLPAGALQVGSMIRIILRGRVSTVVTTPGTLTFDLRLGAVIVSAFGAITLNTVSQVNTGWELTVMAVVRSIGNGTVATALCTASFVSRAIVGSPAITAGSAGETMLPDAAPAVGTGFDSSTAQAINIFATWSVANAGNSIQVHQSLIEFKV